MSDAVVPIVADGDAPSSPLEQRRQPFSPEGGRNGVRPALKAASSATLRQHYYPEGGWGWVVCWCATTAHALTQGLLLSGGVLRTHLLQEFGEEHKQHSDWLCALGLSLGFFISPLIVALCRRKSTRLTAVFGGLTAALGCLFTSFATQMHQVFLSYGLVMAAGLSLSRVASCLMVGQYFKRKREAVETVVASGTGAGIVLFSICFDKILGALGWRLGLHAITGIVTLLFFLGACYRSASLYHPQRRAIQHLKNQHRKIKEKTPSAASIANKPPIFDWSPLRSRSVLVAMLAAALCSFGIYAPFFHLAPLVSSLGFDKEQVLHLQLHLGCAYCAGCWLSGCMLHLHSSQREGECVVGGRHLCQAAMLCSGAGLLSAVQAGPGGLALSAWALGGGCGALQVALRALLLRRQRGKSFCRAFAYVELAQSIPALLGVPAAGWLDRAVGPRSSFYLGAGCCFAGAAALVLERERSASWSGGRRRGSCSTCASQAPSSCCTQEFQLMHSGSSRAGSLSSHPKCQKTISFSDTVDVADDDDYEDGCAMAAALPEEGGNLDVDMIDPALDICYRDYGHQDVVERRPVRYLCGHLCDVAEAHQRQIAAAKDVTGATEQ